MYSDRIDEVTERGGTTVRFSGNVLNPDDCHSKENFGLARDEGLERVSREEAIDQMERLEQEGAIHTIWTMMTPFIGAICNCQPEDCLGLRTLSLDVETMFRGEQVARVDEELCNGCGLCRESCRFNGVESVMNSGEQKARINALACFGCSLCRNHCPQQALSMVSR